MGIVVNLDVMMAKRKKSVTELAKEVDITMANLSVLKNNKARAVRFQTLDRICRTLQCQPGDILEYVEDDDGATQNGKDGASDSGSMARDGGNREGRESE